MGQQEGLKCRWGNFDYVNKAGETVATTFAALITYKKPDGTEETVPYSAGDPNKWSASEDGKKAINADNPDAQFNQSSNAYILFSNLVSAGFPENRMPDDGDISVLEGLVTYNIGIPEPTRAGLKNAEPRPDGRQRILSVPSKIIQLPGDKKSNKAGRATVKKAPAEDVDVSEELGTFVSAQVEKAGGTITRQKLAMAVLKEKAGDPNKDAMTKAIYAKDFKDILLANGLELDGENVSKVE